MPVDYGYEYFCGATKVCPSCKIEYILSEGFAKNKRARIGYQSWCKNCMSSVQKDRHRYTGKPLPPFKEAPLLKICSTCKIEKRGIDFGKNRRLPDGLDCRCRDCLRIKNIKRRESLKNNPMYRLRNAVSSSVSRSLKAFASNKYGESTFKHLPYTLEELKISLENKFSDGMSWSNYGEWHIDHIRPISSFRFTSLDDADFQACWDLSNLQPLWKIDNISKSSVYMGKRFYYLKEDVCP